MANSMMDGEGGGATTTTTKSSDKRRHTADSSKDKEKDDKNVSNLNDGELKALLDEAMTYKNPKDREGKSLLFNHLLNEAEERERIARAQSAGGSELVRHCNPSAKRNGRHRRKPSSISENMTHGGSLDNLAKEELYDADRHLQRTRKSVSVRQREGGSLPCNVNAGGFEFRFLDDERRNNVNLNNNSLVKKCKSMKPDHIAIDMMESEKLLEHDSLAENFQEPLEMTAKFTSNVTFQVNTDASHQQLVGYDADKTYNADLLHAKLHPNKSNIIIAVPAAGKTLEERKIDENGNHQNASLAAGTKQKKKKVSNEKVLDAKYVQGHRGDIIDDIPKLIEFIDGSLSTKSKLRSKQLQRQDTEGKASKSAKKKDKKENRPELKKSNSMGEISSAKQPEFEFRATSSDKHDKVVMRNKTHSGERPRERRSWGTVETPQFQQLYSNASAENLENWVVPKPKKKSKKRRNSISSGTRPNNAEMAVRHVKTRAPSPDFRSTTTKTYSMPHSDKSNDSSDADSVHSLPIDGLNNGNLPISYADIAKSSDSKFIGKNEWEAPPLSPPVPITNSVVNNNNNSSSVGVVATTTAQTQTPPDVHNIKSFPAISPPSSGASAKTLSSQAGNKNGSAGAPSSLICKNNTSNKTMKCALPAATNQKGFNKMVANHVNNIQTDLSIIQANEKDAALLQFNAQLLPPDVPDVQTIEKLHFQKSKNDYHQQTMKMSPNNVNLSRNNYLNNNASTTPSIVDNLRNCDTNGVVNSGPEAELGQDDDELEEVGGFVDEPRPPPVVILSGGGKEVAGLEFGFAVNEELLSEDVCGAFLARFVAPLSYSLTSHNHDKIVHYVGTAWETAKGQACYYEDQTS